MAIPFFAFRGMVGVGVLMLALVVCSWWVWMHGKLADERWFLKLCELAAPLGFVAVLAGWITTEVGRQPWVVYRLLRTGDAVTPSLTAGDVFASLAVYLVAYAAIFGAGGYFLVRLLRTGPTDKAVIEQHPVATPARPMSAAADGE